MNDGNIVVGYSHGSQDPPTIETGQATGWTGEICRGGDRGIWRHLSTWTCGCQKYEEWGRELDSDPQHVYHHDGPCPKHFKGNWYNVWD